jgi:hypothetical protein
MEEKETPDPATRIVLELSSENGTISGALITAEGSRSFWGWLELMSALELAAAASPVEPSGRGAGKPG